MPNIESIGGDTERLNLFKDNYTMAYSAKVEVMNNIDKSIAVYEAVKMDDGANDNSMIMKDVKRSIEGLIPKLVEPFVSTENSVMAEPTEYGSEDGARLHEAVLNDELDALDKQVFFEDIARTMVIQGTVWLKAGWKDMRATSYLCENDAVFPDPSAKKTSDLKFMVYRRRVNKITIKENEGWFGKGSYEKVKDITNSEEDYSAIRNIERENNGYDDSFNFEPGDIRELVTVYEYYGYDPKTGKPIIFIWCDDYILRDEASPFTKHPIPFVNKQFIRVPNTLWGGSLPLMIDDYQKVRSDIINGVLDNMVNANNGQKFIVKGAVDYVNFKRMENGEKIIQVNKLPKDSMEDGSYNQIPQSTFSLLEMMQIEEENITGVTRFSQGNDPRALQSTARGIQSLSSMAEQRTLHVTRSISALVRDLMYIWMDFNMEYLPEVSQVKLADGSLMPFRVSELSTSMKIDVVVGTAGVNEKKVQDAMVLLNIVKSGFSNIPKDAVNELIATIADASNLPAVARKIRQSAEETQGNDDAEAMMAELQTQAQLADIAEKNANAEDKMASAHKKIVDADLAGVKARTEILSAINDTF
jgi:hypothetical protein